jgi:hypothetical protein
VGWPRHGFDNLTDPDVDFEPYLVQLGVRLPPRGLARTIVGAQVSGGQAPKPSGEPRPSQVVTNDEAQADLIDKKPPLKRL